MTVTSTADDRHVWGFLDAGGCKGAEQKAVIDPAREKTTAELRAFRQKTLQLLLSWRDRPTLSQTARNALAGEILRLRKLLAEPAPIDPDVQREQARLRQQRRRARLKAQSRPA